MNFTLKIFIYLFLHFYHNNLFQDFKYLYNIYSREYVSKFMLFALYSIRFINRRNC